MHQTWIQNHHIHIDKLLDTTCNVTGHCHCLYDYDCTIITYCMFLMEWNDTRWNESSARATYDDKMSKKWRCAFGKTVSWN